MFSFWPTIYKQEYSQNETNKPTMLKLYFLHSICHKSDMFRSILIIFREFVNFNEACIKRRWIIKSIKSCA